MPITDELLMTTAASSNTTLGAAITLDGTVMTPSQVDDAFRELMAYRARAITRHVAKAAGTYSAAKADHNQFWRCTGAVTINLAAAATLTDGWCLWVRANGGAVTLDPSGAELIDGAATLVLSDGQTALVVCTGTAFFTVAGGAAGPAGTSLDALTLKGTAIASATTTDIGASTGRFVHITGTTTITGFGTKAAGVERELVFDGALTLTHNATSLILPGEANITTAANDVAIMVSEGSGNWRCVSYQRAARGPNPGWELITTSNLPGAASAPFTDLSAFRRLRATGFLRPATDAVTLRLQTSTNNGSSYDAGASDYIWQFGIGTAGTPASQGDTGDPSVQISPNSVGNATEEGISFTLTLENFNVALSTWAHCEFWSISDTGAMFSGTSGGKRVDSVARNAFRLIFSAGNISIGNITLEGIRG